MGRETGGSVDGRQVQTGQPARFWVMTQPWAGRQSGVNMAGQKAPLALSVGDGSARLAGLVGSPVNASVTSVRDCKFTTSACF
jgi:hypothetical protein